MYSLIFYILYLPGLGGVEASSKPQISISSSLDSERIGASAITSATRNAPQIFNTIFGAMRPWSSAIHHNGMSLFPITIPPNTLLYHGDANPEPVKGLEWLSVHVNVAEAFSRFDPQVSTSAFGPSPPFFNNKFQGYLHTYRTTYPLTNILYFDGQSAAKSSLGTLDLQENVLLLNSTFRSRPGYPDTNRAKEICATFPDLQGIVRMVTDFEVIICNFSTTLEFVGAKRRPFASFDQSIKELQVLTAESARSNSQGLKGIESSRALVNYSSMVSAFFYPFNLTNPDPQRHNLPRINPDEKDLLEIMRGDVMKIFDGKVQRANSIDWQAVADMIVKSYSDQLLFITNDKTNKQDMLAEVNFLIDQFIDFDSVNLSSAQQDCVTHHLVPRSTLETTSDELIYYSIYTVMEKICKTLFEARRDLIEHEGRKIVHQTKLSIRNLMDWLDWSTWRECGKCHFHKVCYVAMWPWGTKKDHDKPGCVDVHEIFGRTGYWDYEL